MSILVKKSGILTTVQDLGRFGCRSLGINPTGAMDISAVRLINTLLGNESEAPVLEMHFPAGEYVFEERRMFAVGGAEFDARLNGEPIDSWMPHTANPGSVLAFARRKSGNRAYLAIEGGFAVNRWKGSASTNLAGRFGGFEGRRLAAADRLEFQCLSSSPHSGNRPRISSSLTPRYSSFPTVRIIAGAEFEVLSAASEETLLKGAFIVSNLSNRMGFRLHGEPLHLIQKVELLSSAVNYGTIQLLPDGQMIILMADHQTTGGYPRIAHVVTRDLPLVAQLGANDGIGFHLVTIAEAEKLALEFERDLKILRIGRDLLM
jgi:antagonist of KipI